GILAEHGVRRQTVFTAIAVGDRHGDLLAQPGAERALAQGAEGPPHALQGGRRVGHGLEHVGRGAKGLVDLGQQGLAGGGSAVGFDVDAGHADLLEGWRLRERNTAVDGQYVLTRCINGYNEYIKNIHSYICQATPPSTASRAFSNASGFRRNCITLAPCADSASSTPAGGTATCMCCAVAGWR